MNPASRCIWYISKYVAPPTPSSPGGRGYLLMKELARRGFQAVVIASDANQLAEVPDLDGPYLLQKFNGVQFWWVSTLKFKVAKSILRVLSLIDFEWRLFSMPKKSIPVPDAIVVSSLSLLTILNGLRLRRKYRCRLIFEIRDIWPLTLTEEGGFRRSSPFILFLGWVERLGYRHADAIVGTMPNLKEHVRNVLGYPKQTGCIPMGVDDSMLSDSIPVPADYRKKNLPEGKFIVAHAGTIGITNALETFLDCAKSLSGNDRVHFVVLGDGDLLKYYTDRYGHLPNLTFAPKVAKHMVKSVLEKCDLLYFSVHRSAVWRYGQSLNKVIDYMLAARPIVASYTGYPSMIDEAGCGSFVPAGDSAALREEIIRYSEMPEAELSRIGALGRDWILANRAYEKLAEEYLRILFPWESGSADGFR